MPWIRTLAVIFTLCSTAALAQPVIKDGKEWLQPVDFVNLSWNDVALVCDPDTGLCDGELNNIDVTGYTWASVDDVNGLFNTYGVTPPLVGPSAASEAGSSWAPLAFLDFEPTAINQDYQYAWAWASTQYTTTLGHLAEIIDRFDDSFFDEARSTSYAPFFYSDPALGVWLYRTQAIAAPTPVPTVPTYVLIFTVLGLLAIATRRLSRRNAREG